MHYAPTDLTDKGQCAAALLMGQIFDHCRKDISTGRLKISLPGQPDPAQLTRFILGDHTTADAAWLAANGYLEQLQEI